MSKQNIYDNDEFFEGYKKIRNNPNSYNNAVEKPALFSLLPDLSSKSVLDLGCGYGENCMEFIRLGAEHVVGVDLSEKMLKVAKTENKEKGIDYICMGMENISVLNEKFDLIVSSLAIHYIEDFDKLVEDVHSLLNEGGYFIFSQEHPLTSAHKTGDYWTKDEDGKCLHYNFSHYGEQGIREHDWIVKGVIKYHRTFSTIFNTLISKGFKLETVLEPLPDLSLLEEFPNLEKSYHKPDFLLIKARKEFNYNIGR